MNDKDRIITVAQIASSWTHLKIKIGLEFNQSEERKPISSLVNFALIGQNLIQSQSQSLVWYRLKSVSDQRLRLRLDWNLTNQKEKTQSQV